MLQKKFKAMDKAGMYNLISRMFFSLMYICAYFFASMSVSFVFQLVLLSQYNSESFDNGRLTGEALESYKLRLASFSSLILIISAALTLLLLTAFFLARRKNLFRYCRFEKTPFIVVFNSFILGAFLNLFLLKLCAMLPLKRSWIEANSESVSSFMLGNPWVALAAVLIVAPFIEELVFRGLVYNTLKSGYGVYIAAVLSSLIFGFIHGNALQGVYSCITALVIVFFYEKSGSIWSGIAIHIGFNSSPIFLGGISGAMKNWQLTVLSAIVLIMVFFILNKNIKIFVKEG